MSNGQRDVFDELMPQVVLEYEQALRRGVGELVRTGRTRLDLPTGHVEAALKRRGLLRTRGLVTRAYRGDEEVMSGWTRISGTELVDDSESLLKYLAAAALHSLYDLR